jgi:hypothetical protein
MVTSTPPGRPLSRAKLGVPCHAATLTLLAFWPVRAASSETTCSQKQPNNSRTLWTPAGTTASIVRKCLAFSTSTAHDRPPIDSADRWALRLTWVPPAPWPHHPFASIVLPTPLLSLICVEVEGHTILDCVCAPVCSQLSLHTPPGGKNVVVYVGVSTSPVRAMGKLRSKLCALWVCARPRSFSPHKLSCVSWASCDYRS